MSESEKEKTLKDVEISPFGRDDKDVWGGCQSPVNDGGRS
jgi:hypothetical protein